MSTELALQIPDDVIDRFWSKVDIRLPFECWEWQACRKQHGYGFFGSGLDGHPNNTLAHRMAWMLEYGPIPEGFKILHRCDNPPCVNLNHLFIGTQHQNVLDMESKGRGRHPAGEACGGSKLTIRQVEQIRELATGGTFQTAIAAQFGIGQSTVSSIVRRATWRAA